MQPTRLDGCSYLRLLQAPAGRVALRPLDVLLEVRKLKKTHMFGGWTPRRPAKVMGSAVAVAFLGKFKRQITLHACDALGIECSIRT